MLTESKDQSVLNHLHLQAHTQKHNIDKLLPQYEYLVNSIVETRLGVKEEEESFGRAYEVNTTQFLEEILNRMWIDLNLYWNVV